MSGTQIKFTDIEVDQCYRLYSKQTIKTKYGDSLSFNFVDEEENKYSSLTNLSLMYNVREAEDLEGYEYFISKGKSELENGNKCYNVLYLKSEEFVETAFPSESDFQQNKIKTVKLGDLELAVEYKLLSKRINPNAKFGSGSIYKLEHPKTKEVVNCFGNKSMDNDYEMYKYPIEKQKRTATVIYQGMTDIPNPYYTGAYGSPPKSYKKHCVSLNCTRTKVKTL